jgi:6-pyruvoyltetrahydropterin/6-carboxytetrahydropterin synthase
MIIRKLFKYEMSHRVVDAYTRRCSHSIHGHSYKLELLFQGNQPDDAQMVMDFGLVKKYFHPFVDSFDHAHAIWDGKDNTSEEVAYIKAHNERWITMPFSSTAEMQAKMFYTWGSIALNELHRKKIITNDVWMNGAIVHETDTGYALYDFTNSVTDKFPDVNIEDIKFSPGIQSEWSKDFTDFYYDYINTK